MWLNISCQGLTIDMAAHEHVERRLGFVLGRFGEYIGRVSVLLTDVNGQDKHCRVVVDILGHARVVVEDVDHDLNVAIDRATDQIGQAVRRKLDRAWLYADITEPKSLSEQN